MNIAVDRYLAPSPYTIVERERTRIEGAGRSLQSILVESKSGTTLWVKANVRVPPWAGSGRLGSKTANQPNLWRESQSGQAAGRSNTHDH